MSQINTFQDLKVWQKSHQLVLEIYPLTRNFPAEEKYSLTSQLRRAAVSVASNIVEGFNRMSIKDSLHFYNIAGSSLEEAKCQLLVAKDLGYLTDTKYAATILLAHEVGKMLNAWCRSQRNNYSA